MTLTDIGQGDECGAPHDNGSRLDHCATCGNCLDHCVCVLTREEAERVERAWADISDWFAALPGPSARRAARPPRWR